MLQQTARNTTALALATRYSLPTLIANAGIKPRSFRRIQPTESLRATMAAPYFTLVRAWQAERAMLLAAYSGVLPDRGAPMPAGATATMTRAVDASFARLSLQVRMLAARFPHAVSSLDRWQWAQWNAKIKAATGLDVAMFHSTSDTASVQANAVAQNGQLLDQVHSDTRGKVAMGFLAALAVRAPASDASAAFNDVMARTKKRAARIGVDQAEGIVADLGRSRAAVAGLERFMWHHTPQKRPRPEHQVRDRKVFSQGNAPNDRAGSLPFCKCWEEWLLG